MRGRGNGMLGMARRHGMLGVAGGRRPRPAICRLQVLVVVVIVVDPLLFVAVVLRPTIHSKHAAYSHRVLSFGQRSRVAVAGRW